MFITGCNKVRYNGYFCNRLLLHMGIRLSLQLLLFLPLLSFAQGQLVISGSSYLVIDNSSKLAVANPAANAIVNTGAGGIMTESEFDQVVWFIGTNTGTYTMPFVSQTTLTQIPFTAAIATAGTGTGNIFFSTYPGPVSDNYVYRPSDVTHMYDYNTNTINNSEHVIDRFWIIDAQGYTTKPAASFTFTYRDIEHTNPTNTIVEADLGAQRFNSGTNQWGDYLPQGTTNTATNTTSGVPVIPANFFRSWTLSETTNPLAVEVLYFNGTCDGSNLTFTWQTSYESNTDHFEIERLNASNQFESIAMIQAQGGGTTYSYQSSVYRSGIFRLVEVTTDGDRSAKANVMAQCESENTTFVYFNDETNDLTIQFESAFPSVEPLSVYDAAGRLIYVSQLQTQKGINTVVVPGTYFSKGMYMVQFKSGQELINEKVMNAY